MGVVLITGTLKSGIHKLILKIKQFQKSLYKRQLQDKKLPFVT